MARYEDLSPCPYFGSHEVTLHSVGWIESRDQLEPGPVDPAFFAALIALLVDPWQPFVAGGGHRCTLCRFTGGPGQVSFGGRVVSVGGNNLFVCDEARVYVAPSSIAHYVDAHEYSPPVEFQRAVMSSPPMRSAAYLKLLRRHGVHRLATPPGRR